MTTLQREVAAVSVYFALYIASLFVYQEGEVAHWPSLVMLPALLLWGIGQYRDVTQFFRSVGIGATPFRAGLYLALMLGIPFQLPQLVNRSNWDALTDALAGSIGFLVPVIALCLLILTAAFTEEFFFRGILQTRVTRLTSSALLGIVVTTIGFIIYHIPYAYLGTAWPSSGNMAGAVATASVNGAPGGLVLGWLFHRSGGNLLAPICLHALIDLIPAVCLVATWFD